MLTRTTIAILCLLMLGISISIAQEDIDTTTYEDDENGITFEYPEAWTEISEYEEGSAEFVDTFAPDESAGMSVIVADAGEGQLVIAQLRESITVADDTDTANYAGVTFTVYDIETPDFNDGIGYVLFTRDLSYDLLIAVLANDGMLDDYLELITSTLELPEADSDKIQTETTIYEDEENDFSFEHPAAWTETFEYDDDVSTSIDITMPDQSAGVTVIVAESGEGQSILDEIGENITIEDDSTTADYAGATFTVLEVEVPNFEDEDGESLFGYILFTEDLSYDLLIGVITTDGMEDDYLDIVMNSLVLPEEPDDDSKDDTDASESDATDAPSTEGLIFAEEFDRNDAGDDLILTLEEMGEEVALEDYILVDMDGTAYLQLEADPVEVLPYLFTLESVPDAYELQMRVRLAQSPFTAVEIDVASGEEAEQFVSVAFNRQDVRISDVIFDTSETSLAIEFYETPRDTWIDLRITVDDDEITVFVDGEEVVSTDDASYVGNNFLGVFVSNGILDIDYIRVYELDD
ncbi:MAG: PsbP-related protein [Chloroflexota bacterium]